jgi:hypothetical protein
MSAPSADTHQNHAHRYAHSHHGTHLDPDEITSVLRKNATTCEHKFLNVDATAEDSMTTEAHADLIAHLEQQSLNWVKKFTSEINGANGGLKQKSIFRLPKHQQQQSAAAARNARDNPESGIAILEKYGT